MARILKPLRRRLELGLRLYYRSAWVNAPYRCETPHIIFGGAERSGTTLLRAAMDSHPMVAAGPESWLFVFRQDLPWLAAEFDLPLAQVRQLYKDACGLAEFANLFLSAAAEKQGKTLWCEKSPRNIRRLDYIWEHFPKARVVHIIRDGRDVSCSLRNHPRHTRVNGEYVPTNIDRPIRKCINRWAQYVSDGLRHRGDDRYLEVHYEELARDYEPVMRRICDHCQLPWSDDLLKREQLQGQRQDMEIVNPEVRKPLYNSSIGRWQRDLSEREVATCMERAGDLLDELGYLGEP
ncbi:MAG: sulfotransferase [Planctomycetota bacterium]|nr:sulfotransferase [Planctomycetota bacterium]MDP6837401.1 sulfotransferase [Planctomycetota bacterium]